MDINVRSFGGEELYFNFWDWGSQCGGPSQDPRDPRLPSLPGGCPRSPAVMAPAYGDYLLGGNSARYGIPSGINLVTPGLKPQYMDEFVVGAEYEVLADLRLGVSYQNRRLGRVIEDTSPDGGRTYIISNPSEFDAGEEQKLLAAIQSMPEGPTRKALISRLQLFRDTRRFDQPSRVYQALQITTTKRFSRAFYVQGSYTYSSLRGNYPGLLSPDNGQLDPNISSQYDLFELLANRYGPLPADRPHSVKLDGYYTFDLGKAGSVTTGARFSALSGSPIGVLGRHALYGPKEAFVLPRGSGGRTAFQTPGGPARRLRAKDRGHRGAGLRRPAQRVQQPGGDRRRRGVHDRCGASRHRRRRERPQVRARDLRRPADEEAQLREHDRPLGAADGPHRSHADVLTRGRDSLGARWPPPPGPALYSRDVEPTERDTPEGASDGERALAPGVAIGRYQVERVVGAGGMGVVFAARDRDLGRTVALKVLRRPDNPDADARLAREARALAKLTHANVVTVYDVGTHEGARFLAMELVEGETLTAWLRRAPRPWRDVVRAFVDAGRGLIATHDAGLVHRDFKPDNVLMDRGGRARVSDFGLARVVDDTAPTGAPVGHPAVAITQTGAIAGTPAYMAPEQLLGRPVDQRADQFGFAVSLYEALAGKRPFGEDVPSGIDALAALVADVTRHRPRPPPGPRWLARIVLRGLEADADLRHPSMEAMVRALERGRGRRRRWTIAAAAAVAAAGVALLIFAWQPPAPVETWRPEPLARDRPGTTVAATISGDGTTLFFASNSAVSTVPRGAAGDSP